MKEIKIITPFIKLTALLKFASITVTGGEAKNIILDGLVKVNGEICEVPGKKIYPGDEIEVSGEIIKIS